jgi:hypothetical protein
MRHTPAYGGCTAGEQTVAVDPNRLGDLVARLPLHEVSEIDNALRTVLGLS